MTLSKDAAKRFFPALLFAALFALTLKISLFAAARLPWPSQIPFANEIINLVCLWLSLATTLGLLSPLRQDVRLKRRSFQPFPVKQFACGIGFGFAYFLTCAFISHPRTTAIALQALRQQNPARLSASLLALVSITLAATLGEECAWRGVFLESLLHKRIKPLLAIALSGLLFGFWHVLDRNHSILDALYIAFCLGFGIDVAYYRTLNLGLCWGLHFGINLAALLTNGHLIAASLPAINRINIVSYFLCMLLGLVLTRWLYKRFAPVQPILADAS